MTASKATPMCREEDRALRSTKFMLLLIRPSAMESNSHGSEPRPRRRCESQKAVRDRGRGASNPLLDDQLDRIGFLYHVRVRVRDLALEDQELPERRAREDPPRRVEGSGPRHEAAVEAALLQDQALDENAGLRLHGRRPSEIEPRGDVGSSARARGDEESPPAATLRRGARRRAPIAAPACEGGARRRRRAGPARASRARPRGRALSRESPRPSSTLPRR